MLENWCWEPSQLKKLSFHYSYISSDYLKAWESQANGAPRPPDQLSDSTVQSLVQSRAVNGALFQLEQLVLCYVDMRVHQPASLEVIRGMDISAEYMRLQRDVSGLDTPEDDGWGHPEACFFPVMEAYDAGYYGYLR